MHVKKFEKVFTYEFPYYYHDSVKNCGE